LINCDALISWELIFKAINDKQSRGAII